MPAQRTCQSCGATFVAMQRTHIYCSSSCRPWSKRTKAEHPRTTPQRGYGYAHQQERKRRAAEVASGSATCCLCAQPIRPNDKWHLDHDDDRTTYRGVAHASCNTRDGRRRQALRLVADLYGYPTIAALVEQIETGRAGQKFKTKNS